MAQTTRQPEKPGHAADTDPPPLTALRPASLVEPRHRRRTAQPQRRHQWRCRRCSCSSRGLPRWSRNPALKMSFLHVR
ncbi:hypothetical protein I552_0362 [Mycobacterium xenopi 3993]|nr:hypothetical protein I552_0362 [Mycobacterium xenopi 3993]